MDDRLRFWGRTLQAGVTPLNTLGGWAGTIILIAGAAVGIVVPVVSHISLWLTAVVLLGLLVLVVAEGAYHVWHITDQDRAELEHQQSDEQRADAARQTEVQELRAQELRASLKQRERDAAERRRAQATQVLLWDQRLDNDPHLTQAQRVTNPESSTPTVTVHVKNGSDQPVFDVVISWNEEVPLLNDYDLVGVMMPGAEVQYTRTLPESNCQYLWITFWA